MKKKEYREYRRIRIFKNPILESFSHVHPILPALVWVPVIGLFARKTYLLKMNWVIVLLLCSFGLITWSLCEYVLHRFVFHWEGQSEFSKKLHFVIHGIHHTEPNDPTRLLMPPLASGLLAVPFYLFFRSFLGGNWVNPFFCTFLLGYLIYDYMHFAAHFHRPRSKMGRALKKFHMDHHFIDPDSNWGVSSVLWDRLF